MRSAEHVGGCPAGEALTALVHGEGSHEERAALLRHVLACPECRPEHDATERVLLGLRALGAARASGAPHVVRAYEEPARARFLPPLVAAAAIGVVLLAAFHRPTPPPTPASEPVPAVAASSTQGARPLLSAQQPDGRWVAERGSRGAGGDEAATGLVVLALLHPGRDALDDAALARAVAAGGQWLCGRADALAEGQSPEDVRTRAVASAALLRAFDLTGDAALRPAARSLLRAVAHDAAAAAGDHVSRPWIDYALAHAERAGWPGAGRDRRLLESAPPAVAPRAPRSVARGEVAPTAPDTPVSLALAALRDEPSLKTLALARMP